MLQAHARQTEVIDPTHREEVALNSQSCTSVWREREASCSITQSIHDLVVVCVSFAATYKRRQMSARPCCLLGAAHHAHAGVSSSSSSSSSWPSMAPGIVVDCSSLSWLLFRVFFTYDIHNFAKPTI